jgi:uncharacterized membrane protein
MTGQPSSDITSDDKLWALLGYIIALIAVIVLFMEDKKNRPFIKFHAVQSIVLWVVITVLYTVLSIVTLGFGAICLWVLFFIPLWPAIDAYTKGSYTNIPVITDFIKGQKWA